MRDEDTPNNIGPIYILISIYKCLTYNFVLPIVTIEDTKKIMKMLNYLNVLSLPGREDKRQ